MHHALVAVTVACLLVVGPALAGADCNGNQIPDADDISNGTSQDCNSNGIPDECESEVAYVEQFFWDSGWSHMVLSDLDSDGDDDVVGAGSQHFIFWHENTDGLGAFGPRTQLVSNIYTATVQKTITADIDGDGDQDLVNAGESNDAVAWHENVSGDATTWISHGISSSVIDAKAVAAADFDGDGDTDVAWAAYGNDRIAWQSNDGLGGFGPAIVITMSADGAHDLIAADLDGDGDDDLLAASQLDDTVQWFENTGGGFSLAQVISTSIDMAWRVQVGDLDGDSDLDLLAHGRSTGQVELFRNDDGTGTFLPWQTLSTSSQVWSISATDLDNDLDVDILIAQAGGGTTWFENPDGAGSFGIAQQLLFGVASAAAAADVDHDGDRDVVTAGASTAGSGAFFLEAFTGDCDRNDVPDVCEVLDDCDANGVADLCETASGAAADCNTNAQPDACDIADGVSQDCGELGNGVPDECEPDCDANSVVDSCDVASGTSEDCDGDGLLDDCESTVDCNGNGTDDLCDFLSGVSLDCNANSLPDECDVAGGEPDCNGNLVPDLCEVQLGWDISIVDDTPAGTSVGRTDVDGDGDVDLLAALAADGIVAWYENVDGDFGPRRVVTSGAVMPTAVSGLDVDDDDDTDLLVGSDGAFAWYENTDGLGSFGPQQVLSLEGSGARTIFLADLDGDQDDDVLLSSFTEGRISRFENLAGGLGPEQVLGNGPSPVNVVVAVDVDSDGDPDVVTGHESIPDTAELFWYENLDGAGTLDTQQVLKQTSSERSVEWLATADTDVDGDLDLLGALSGGAPAGKVGVALNLNGFGAYSNFGSGGEFMVSDPQVVAPGDVDGDGDTDFIFASGSQGIRWLEYVDGGFVLPPRDVTGAASDSMITGDLDQDGDLDFFFSRASTIRVALNRSDDCNGDGIPDDCHPDCNANGIADTCDVRQGTDTDCDANGVLDGCEVPPDCNANGVPDGCDTDCNGNGLTDECELAGGAADCDGNGVPDDCDADCNANGLPDACDVAGGSSMDCDGDGVPDECTTAVRFTRHVIYPIAVNTREVLAADLDGDSDLDVVSSGISYPRLSWFENLDGAGAFGNPQLVADSSMEALSVGDLDGDTDLDIISGNTFDEDVVWFENLDAAGSYGPQQIIGALTDTVALEAADLDGDTDLDLLAVSDNSAWDTVWFESVDAADSFLPAEFIAPHGRAVTAADVDGDLDFDVIVGEDSAGLRWYENDGAGLFGAAQTIDAGFNAARSVVAADLDGDLDPDILAASFTEDEIAWFENLDGDGSFGARQVIAVTPGSYQRTAAVDLDGDGDLDVVWSSDSTDTVAWNENLSGGAFGPSQTVSSIADDVRSIFADDIDGDGDQDLLSASEDDFLVVWYENSVGEDCNGNDIPDSCDFDCNTNGVPDSCEEGVSGADCNINGVPDLCETSCTVDCDTDGDGCLDEFDSHPADPMQCTDVDGDGCDDCRGGSLDPANDGPDGDADGWCNIGDCAPDDATAWSLPTAARDLRMSKSGGIAWLNWTPPVELGGTAVFYDTLRSNLPDDFAAGSPITLCWETDDPDTTSGDSGIVLPAPLHFYLIRAENVCPASGDMGSDSEGLPRTGQSCGLP